MKIRLIVTIALMVGFLVPGASAMGGQRSAAFKAENNPENLKSLLELVFRKMFVERSSKESFALFQSMFPDEARLRKALREDVEPAVIQKMLDNYRKFADDAASFGEFAKPGQTVVKIWGATTDEIWRYDKGSVAYKEFPGGARQLAAQILRPGVTFYEAEFLEPGTNAGMKYHLFYWDGQQWSMVGAAWRVLP